MRAIISLNWVLGSLFFMVAVLFPALDQHLLTGQKKNNAETMVERIARWEEGEYTNKEKYTFFSDNAVSKRVRDELGFGPIGTMDFTYSVSLADDGALMIRARASDKEIKSGGLPPLTYIYKKEIFTGGEPTKEWLKLSGKSGGLF
jgi:hypothetical protein